VRGTRKRAIISLFRRCIVKKSAVLWICLCLVLTGLAAPGFSKDKVVESKWAAAPLTIDGFDVDWAGTPMNAADDGMAEYAVKNDGTYLYLLFSIKNPKFLTTIGKTGLTVYFSPDLKKSKDRGLRLVRRGIPTEAFISSVEKNGGTISEEQKAQLRTRPYQIIFYCDPIGKKSDKAAATQASVTQTTPVYTAVGNQNFVVFECRIPLSREGNDAGIGAEPGKPIKLGFEWGGSPSDIKGMVQGPGEKPPQDVDSAAQELQEGAPDIDTGSLDSMQIRRRPKKYTFWLDLTLATATA
jgi:hypothetical protein